MRLWNKTGIMMFLEMQIQELLLSETFITLSAVKWFLSSVDTPMHYHVTFLFTCIITLVTLKAFLIPVGLLMLNKCVALMEHSLTVTALHARACIGMLLS